MRFDQEVWHDMPVIERAGYWMSCVIDRARRFCACLDAADVPYAVCGGMSVMAWVTSRDSDYARTTKDVDILMRREDLRRAAEALAPHGFMFVEVNGIPMFLDGPDGTPKHAVHVVVADEQPSRFEVIRVPELAGIQRDGAAPWPRVDLATLIEMKLLAMRPHDIAHLGDLLRVGLIDRTWRDRIRPELRERFDRAYDEAERHYGGSVH
jgi:hypothetical protein